MNIDNRFVRALGFAFALMATTLGVLPSAARAECSAIDTGGVCRGTVEKLYLHTNGNLYIYTDGDERRLTGCTLSEEGILLPASHPMFDSFLSLLMAAQLSGHTAHVRAVNTNGKCSFAYVILEGR